MGITDRSRSFRITAVTVAMGLTTGGCFGLGSDEAGQTPAGDTTSKPSETGETTVIRDPGADRPALSESSEIVSAGQISTSSKYRVIFTFGRPIADQHSNGVAHAPEGTP